MAARSFYITKVVEFSAAHRLYREELTESQNQALFGACANPFGHGHNYVLECTFKGPRIEETQMVIHFSELKSILHEVVFAPLDHRNLNQGVDFMAGVLPTSENLIEILWDRLCSAIQGRTFQLFKLKLSSTPRNWIEYFGPQ